MGLITNTTSGLTPYVPSSTKPWNKKRVTHLLRRARIGPPSRDEIEFFLSLSPSEAVDKLF